jgi:hypothetical protein
MTGRAGDANAANVTQAANDLAFCVTDANISLAMTWRERVTQMTQRRKIAGPPPAAAEVSSRARPPHLALPESVRPQLQKHSMGSEAMKSRASSSDRMVPPCRPTARQRSVSGLQ